MIQLYVGTLHQLNTPLNVKMGDAIKEIKEVNSILPLCMTKFDLLHEDGILKVGSIEEDPLNPVSPVTQIVYELDNYVDENGTLIIRPTRNYIFKRVVNEGMTEEKARTAFEHIDDFQMDLTIKIADALIANGTLILNQQEQTNYDSLKDQWSKTTSVTLNSATYEINYAFNGDGSSKISPKGLKSVARSNAQSYHQLLDYFRITF